MLGSFICCEQFLTSSFVINHEEVTSTWLKVEFQVFSAAVNVNV